MGLLFDSYTLDILVASITIIYLFYSFFTSSFNHWKDRGIPFIEPTVFVGNLKENLLNKKSIFEVQNGIYSALSPNKLGGYFEFKSPVLMIRDPEIIEKILIKDFAYFHDRGLPHNTEVEPLSGNLFNVEGTYWRSLRYKLTPTFTTGKLKSMFEQVSKCAVNLVTYIDKQAKAENCFDAKNLISRFSVDVIASCAFGVEFNYDTKEGTQFRNMVNVVFTPSKLQLIRFSLLMYYPKITKYISLRTFKEEVSSYFLQIIKDTIQYRKEKHIDRNDFVQLLLTLKEQEENGKNMYASLTEDYSEEDAIINQMNTVPGHDDYRATDKTKSKLFWKIFGFTFVNKINQFDNDFYKMYNDAILCGNNLIILHF